MIPFCKTTLGKEEKKAMSKLIDSGWVVMGEKTKEFEHKFAEYVGAKHAVFVDSGTSALFLAHRIFAEDKPKWTVPSLTFTATAEAAINAGMNIGFKDVSKENLCLEEVTEHSTPVHLCGVKAKDGAIIYDSAHRIEKDDVKGSDAIWCYSFYATKNMTTIQGGMICTNTDAYAEWLRQARDHGLDLGTKERYQGRYKQYDVRFVGYREKSDDLHAVIGLEQLKKLPAMTERRNQIVERYNKGLGLNNKGNHVYPILVDHRAMFMDFMFHNEIQTTVHFRPLHLMTGYKKYAEGVNLPNTEYIGERIVSLPIYPDLSDQDVDYIISKVNESGVLLHS